MFAGPNGSGKSTLKSYLPASLLGVYLNPDEIEQEIRNQGFLGFASYGVSPAADEVLSFFNRSEFLKQVGLSAVSKQLKQFAGMRKMVGRHSTISTNPRNGSRFHAKV